MFTCSMLCGGLFCFALAMLGVVFLYKGGKLSAHSTTEEYGVGYTLAGIALATASVVGPALAWMASVNLFIK